LLEFILQSYFKKPSGFPNGVKMIKLTQNDSQRIVKTINNDINDCAVEINRLNSLLLFINSGIKKLNFQKEEIENKVQLLEKKVINLNKLI